MAISTETKRVLGIAMGNVSRAAEIVTALDASVASPAANVAEIGATSNLTALVPVAAALNSTFSDTEVEAALLLKADNADVETLRTEVEARLDALEAKMDELLAALVAAGLMSA